MTMHCVRWAKLGTCARDGSAYLGPGHKKLSIGTTDPAHSGCSAAAVQTHAAVWPAENWHAMLWLLRGAERRAAAQSGAKRTLGLQGCSGKEGWLHLAQWCVQLGSLNAVPNPLWD